MASSTIASTSIALFKTTTQSLVSNPTWDIIVICMFLAIGFFYGISSTKRKIVSIIFLTYTTFAIFPIIPIEWVATSLQQTNLFYVQTGAFLILFLALYILLGEKGKSRIPRTDPWWQLFLLSFLAAGLLLHFLFSFLSKEDIERLSFITREGFASGRAQIFWLLLPLLGLIIVKKFEVARR